jgi:hypothetical protein
MFKALTYTLLTLSFLLASGCSTNSNKIWFHQSEALAEIGNYKKALSQLKIEKKTNTQLYKKIKKEDRLHANKKIEIIKSEITSKHWGKANALLSTLIENHSWKKQFEILDEKINRARNDELRLIETNVKLAQANLLQSKLAQYDFHIRAQDGDHSWSFTKAFLTSEKNTLAKSLYSLSIQALAVQDYVNAQKTYNQALQLNSDLQKYELSKTIHAGFNKSNKKTIQKQQTSLLKSLNKALAEENFTQIITLQKILSNAPFQGPEVNAAVQRSYSFRLNQAKLLDKKADSVYRHGNVTLAIKLWKKARLLAPKLESVQEKLTRAKKVQSKLKQLRSQNGQ